MNNYGVIETNPIDDRVKAVREAIEITVDLDDPRLRTITRLRLLTDQGFPLWDLSYCYGALKDGTPVRVQLPWHQFSRRYLKRDLIAMCKQAGVYGKGIGILEESNWSLLYG